MANRRSSDSSLRRIHALVERYTPDGALGRGILGAVTGTLGLWLVAIALFEIPRWGLTLAALLWLPTLLATGIPLLAFTAIVLWPLYLSLIGNLESTDEYAVPGAASTGARTGASESAASPVEREVEGTDADDPFADLKSQYERGDLSEAEFERLVEARLEESSGRSADGVSDAPRGRDDPGRDPALERE